MISRKIIEKLSKNCGAFFSGHPVAVMAPMAILTVMATMAVMAIIVITPSLTFLDCLKGLEP